MYNEVWKIPCRYRTFTKGKSYWISVNLPIKMILLFSVARVPWGCWTKWSTEVPSNLTHFDFFAQKYSPFQYLGTILFFLVVQNWSSVMGHCPYSQNKCILSVHCIQTNSSKSSLKEDIPRAFHVSVYIQVIMQVMSIHKNLRVRKIFQIIEDCQECSGSYSS